jgi:hypothetical protein
MEEAPHGGEAMAGLRRETDPCPGAADVSELWRLLVARASEELLGNFGRKGLAHCLNNGRGLHFNPAMCIGEPLVLMPSHCLCARRVLFTVSLLSFSLTSLLESSTTLVCPHEEKTLLLKASRARRSAGGIQGCVKVSMSLISLMGFVAKGDTFAQVPV